MLPTDANKVLLCLRYGIGDVVMELPALARLREVLPRADITALAAPPAGELLDGSDRVDRVVSIRRWGVRHRWDAGDASVRASISRWIEEEAFDLLLDVGHAPTAFRKAVEGRGIRWLEAHNVEERRTVREGGSGVTAIARAVREGWGMPLDDHVVPTLDVREEDRAFARELLRDAGLGGSAPSAISPVASARLKRWPVDRFARVADVLAEQGPRPVLIVAGPQVEAGEAVRDGMRRPADACVVGPHHLLRTAALLARCRVLVCNDTGLMHVSAAVGTRTVAVFGPTSATVYRPPGRHARAVETRVPCRHRAVGSLFPPTCWECDRCLIAETGCMESVGVEEVLAELSHGAGAPPGRAAEAAAGPSPASERLLQPSRPTQSAPRAPAR